MGDQLDVEGEYWNFTRKMKSGGRSRRMTWLSVAAAVVILISASCGGYWKIRCRRKARGDSGGRNTLRPEGIRRC